MVWTEHLWIIEKGYILLITTTKHLWITVKRGWHYLFYDVVDWIPKSSFICSVDIEFFVSISSSIRHKNLSDMQFIIHQLRHMCSVRKQKILPKQKEGWDLLPLARAPTPVCRILVVAVCCMLACPRPVLGEWSTDDSIFPSGDRCSPTRPGLH
jgi:hypothetical protein